MNALHEYLTANRSALGLERHEVAPDSGFVMLTPRFGASRHVVFIVFSRASGRPAVVAKIPRLKTDGEGIAREAAVLRRLEASGLTERGLVPRVLALGEFFGHGLLLETALVGRPLDPAFIRRSPRRAIDAVVRSLSLLPSGGTSSAGAEGELFERLIGRPLLAFAGRFTADDIEQRLVEETLEITGPLAGGVSGIMEHGDVSHPNLLWLGHGHVGIVDWELATVEGLPLHDLFFFLCYAASARARARRVEEHVRAFRSAFIGRSAWTRPIVEAYAERTGIARHLIAPLLVACWARSAVGLLARLADGTSRSSPSEALASDEKLAFRARREYMLWRHVVANFEHVSF